MAPRPRNTQPPVPPTTVPGKQSSLSKLLSQTTVPTTIPAPTPTPTTVPTAPRQSSLSRLVSGQQPPPPSETIKVGPVQVPRAISTTPDVLEANKALRDQTRNAIKAGVPTTKIQEIVTGESPKEGKLAKVFNWDIIPGQAEFRPIKTVVAPALGGLATGGRFVISANEEAIDFVKQKGKNTKVLIYEG